MEKRSNRFSMFQGVAAAAVAVAITSVSGWGFVDSTRIARWVSAPAEVANHLVRHEATGRKAERFVRTGGGERKARGPFVTLVL